MFGTKRIKALELRVSQLECEIRTGHTWRDIGGSFALTMRFDDNTSTVGTSKYQTCVGCRMERIVPIGIPH